MIFVPIARSCSAKPFCKEKCSCWITIECGGKLKYNGAKIGIKAEKDDEKAEVKTKYPECQNSDDFVRIN